MIDDLIAYLRRRGRGLPGAQRGEHRRGGRAPASRAAPEGVTVTNQHRDFARARRAGPAIGRGADARSACRPSMDYMGYAMPPFAGVPVTRLPHRLHRRARLRAVCRRGTRRRAVGRAGGGRGTAGGGPAGLGARDTLRTEMGYPLHGHELSPEISPLQARCRLGGGLEEGRLLGPRRAAGREGGRAAAAAVGVADGRARRPAARANRPRRGQLTSESPRRGRSPRPCRSASGWR